MRRRSSGSGPTPFRPKSPSYLYARRRDDRGPDVSLHTVESTEGILEIWFCESFPPWGFLKFGEMVRVYLWFRVYPEFLRNPALIRI